MLTPTMTFGMRQLQPYHNPASARLKNVNLLAGTYLPGTLLGEVTDVEADALQTITITGTPTGGNITLAGTPFVPGSSGAIVLPYNATAAVAQPLFDAVYGIGNTVVGGGALPGTALTVKFVGVLSAQPIPAITITSKALAGGTSPDASIAQTTTGVLNVGTFGAYAHGNSDGTQVAKMILQYGCTVDATGAVTISAEIPGLTQPHAPAYYRGTFRTDDLVGLPSSGNMAVDFPGARIVQGDLTSGVLVLA
jgi:hypothetical protein